jgi:hypothetical protein
MIIDSFDYPPKDLGPTSHGPLSEVLLKLFWITLLDVSTHLRSVLKKLIGEA